MNHYGSVILLFRTPKTKREENKPCAAKAVKKTCGESRLPIITLRAD
jgi:hypothetical protein